MIAAKISPLHIPNPRLPDPPIDTRGTAEFIQHQAALADNCNVFVVACVSKNREGKELAEIGQLVKAGAVAFSVAHDRQRAMRTIRTFENDHWIRLTIHAINELGHVKNLRAV